MIKYNLICDCGKEFESWFSDSKEYEKLEKKNMLSCICGNSKKVTKQLMSPQVISSKESESKNIEKKNFHLNLQKKLSEIRDYVEKNAEFVGDKFVSEVRSIHYDQKNVRNVYGHATPEETEELQDEGINVATIPWINKTNS